MDKFILAEVPLFKELNEKEFSLVRNFFIEKKYKENEKIFRKGTIKDKIIIITDGQAALKSNINNQETIALFKTNNFLGEVSFLQKHSKHHYDLEANTPVSTLELSIYNWHTIIKKQATIANKIYKNIALTLNERLKHANNKLVSLFAASNVISNYKNLDEIAEAILKILLQIIPSDKALLATFSIDTQKMHVHKNIGYKKINDHALYDIKEDQLLKKLIQNPETTILTKDNFKTAYTRLPYISDSLIITPIKIRDKIIGFIMLADKANGRNFSGNNKILLEAIASQTAPAIQQINLKKIESAQADIKNVYIEPF